MSKVPSKDQLDDADRQYIDEHLQAVAERFRTVAGEDPREAFGHVQYMMRRLAQLMRLQSKANVSYIAVMSLLGQGAGANVMDAAKEQIEAGRPDWTDIAAALNVSAKDARRMFLGS